MTTTEHSSHPDTPAEFPTVTADGELHAENLEPLRAQLLAAAAHSPAVVLDAANLTFGDSSLLRVLLEVNQRTDLRIAAPVPFVARLISMVGMDRVLRLFPTVEEATAAPLREA
jgi:anti-anti-sigma factor